ncbi:hypothetical protein LINPERPRIM_LOCUS19564 [Linum perenne]
MGALTVTTPCFLKLQQTSASSVPDRCRVRSRCSSKAPKPARIMIRSSSYPSSCFSITSKTFENPVEGIVCYTDERTGEVICEGYDEGPRFHHQQNQQLPSLSAAYSTRDGEIITNLLQQRLLQIVNGGDDDDHFEGTGAVIPLQEDLSKFHMKLDYNS